jgi:hypothetical protein
MKAQASSANIQAWLESKDPRLIAWGAYFARENDDTAALDLAAQLIKKSLDQGGPDLLSGSGPQNDALSEILDALIQRQIPLSADLLEYVSRSHPVQTIILLSRLTPAEQTADLEQWYGGVRPDGPYHLARVSAMLLSKAPPPGFAASLLGDSEESLLLYIVPSKDIGMGMGSGYGGACGDSGGSSRASGWPELFRYELDENNHSADPLLVEAGGDRITWKRAPSSEGWGSCYGVRPLSAETRHHLLAEMLEERDEALPWPTQKVVNIVWESKEQVQRDIGATIEAEQTALRKSVQEFQARGLITPKRQRPSCRSSQSKSDTANRSITRNRKCSARPQMLLRPGQRSPPPSD